MFKQMQSVCSAVARANEVGGALAETEGALK